MTTKLLMMTAALMLIAARAHAQDAHAVEIAAGYHTTYGAMQGWTVQVSRPLTPRLSVLAEVNRSRGRDCADCDPIYNDLGVLAGVRYQWRRGARFEPSWQLLAGALHSKSEAYSVPLLFGGTYFEDSYTVNYLAVQPGAGFTVMMTPRVGLRLQTDLQFAIPNQSEYEGISLFPRVAVGAVVRLGR